MLPFINRVQAVGDVNTCGEFSKKVNQKERTKDLRQLVSDKETTNYKINEDYCEI